MRAYLDDGRATVVPCEVDPGGPLLAITLPSGVELSLSDGFDGAGPLALRHFAGRQEPQEYPVSYDDVDGVAVYRIATPDGDLVVPACHVPLITGIARPVTAGAAPRGGAQHAVAGGRTPVAQAGTKRPSR